MAALTVSDNLATALKPTTAATGAVDAALHAAAGDGVVKASDATFVAVPAVGGYADFDANMQLVLRQTFMSQCMALFLGAWVAPAFLNSWANAAGYEVAGYRLEGGRLWLKGSISGGANGTVAFNLPAAFRPALKVRMAAAGSVVEVATNGDVTIVTTGTIGLDGVSYAL